MQIASIAKMCGQMRYYFLDASPAKADIED